MANKKGNPLSGAFRSPAPDDYPPWEENPDKAPSKPDESKKPAEPPKEAVTAPKATGPAAPAKPDEGKKPAEPPKETAAPKATGPAVPAKPDEGKKPAEPPKETAAPKATGPATPAKPDEGKKPTELPKETVTDPKAAGPAAPSKPSEGKKPAEPPKETTAPKTTGPAAPSKPDEGKKPAEPPKEAVTDPKATGPAAPAKPDEGKKPAEPLKEAVTNPKATGPAAPKKPDEGKKPTEPPKEATIEPKKDSDLRFVKLSQIVPLPGTYVKDTPREDYKDLIASAKKDGLTKPVILRKGEKGDYQLVDGFHRCKALEQDGALEIRAEVYEMSILEASRYRKEHRTNPNLPIPGKLIPLHPPAPEKPAEVKKPAEPPKAAIAIIGTTTPGALICISSGRKNAPTLQWPPLKNLSRPVLTSICRFSLFGLPLSPLNSKKCSASTAIFSPATPSRLRSGRNQTRTG